MALVSLPRVRIGFQISRFSSLILRCPKESAGNFSNKLSAKLMLESSVLLKRDGRLKSVRRFWLRSRSARFKCANGKSTNTRGSADIFIPDKFAKLTLG